MALIPGTKTAFIPNDSSPSDAEKTQYNVFINDEFTGYIVKDWMEYWWYYVNGKKCAYGQSDRCDLFALIIEDPMFGRKA